MHMRADHLVDRFPPQAVLKNSMPVISGFITANARINNRPAFVAFNQVIVFLAMLFIFQQTPSLERTAGVSLICLGMLFVARGG